MHGFIYILGMKFEIQNSQKVLFFSTKWRDMLKFKMLILEIEFEILNSKFQHTTLFQNSPNKQSLRVDGTLCNCRILKSRQITAERNSFSTPEKGTDIPIQKY